MEHRTIALKEEPNGVAEAEFDVLRRLEAEGLPAVLALGLATSVEGDAAILATEYLAYSIQYRRLLMRFPLGPGPYRDRLLDAMASLLVDLHRAGVFWGDCSLANTLFRRDGDKIQAYLVDAETSEIHPTLSDGQRAFDLDILVENVGFGLADLGAMQGREDAFEDAVEAAETVRARYLALWDELHDVHELSPDDRHGVRARIRRLNELGFAVDEISLEPTPAGDSVRLRVAVANRRFHARELERLTGLIALEGQARLLLNDIREHQAWLEHSRGRAVPMEEAAQIWLSDVLEPSLRKLAPIIGPTRDPIQAYCDVLEEKWLLSEAAGADVGLDAALPAYLALGAPAPEDTGPDSTVALDIDWSGGFESPAEELETEA
jgi:tRNA A-37 threonylcarbamoyl transferase component Bud32